ncbi:MAG: sulfatase [Reichenbachiella sp.]|uniref:sulfatase n=1 Tax=Reichenbachiella sp. TaxID=2184521 RepID=UPI003297F713
MKNKRVLVIVFACLMHIFQFTQAQKKPNVLFIVIDDLNNYVNVLQKFPGLKTPNLNSFAQRATTFVNAHSQAVECNPSRVSILSGLLPSKTDIYKNQQPITSSQNAKLAQYLPEVFRNDGYWTINAGKIFHGSNKWKSSRFKSIWNSTIGINGQLPAPTENNIPNKITNIENFEFQPWKGPLTDHPDYVNAELIKKELQKNHNSPFFIALGFHNPHPPWTVPKKYFDMYPLDEIELPPFLEDDFEDLPLVAKELAEKSPNFELIRSGNYWKQIVQAYMASVSFMDAQLGNVLKALEKSQYNDNTVVCIMSDNGYHLGEKKHFSKFTLWEISTNVLLMIQTPRFQKNQIVSAPVNLVDVYPTLLEVCSISNPIQELDGYSLMPLIESPDSNWPHPSISMNGIGNIGIVKDNYHYIKYKNGSEELYNLETDKNEWTNLANEVGYDNTIRKLKKFIPNDPFYSIEYNSNKRMLIDFKNSEIFLSSKYALGSIRLLDVYGKTVIDNLQIGYNTLANLSDGIYIINSRFIDNYQESSKIKLEF